MPNFGFYEWFCIFMLSGAPVFILFYLALKSLPGTLKEIRKMWHSADPNDNHKGN